MKCLGCRLANKEQESFTIIDTNDFAAILDNDPFNEGHILILPKDHIEEIYELSEQQAKSIF